MKKQITELLMHEEYIDDDLKAMLSKLNESDEIDTLEILTYIVREHKDATSRLQNEYVSQVYNYMRKVANCNQWRSLLYMSEYAVDNAVMLLENNNNCKLSDIMLTSVKLNKKFGALGINDRKRMFELYENDFGERDE